MYSSTFIANNVLSRCFASGRLVNVQQLQNIIFLVAKEYQSLTGKQLLEELFSAGPVLYSVQNKFACLGNKSIDCYARDAKNKVWMIDEKQDVDLQAALDRVWWQVLNQS